MSPGWPTGVSATLLLLSTGWKATAVVRVEPDRQQKVDALEASDHDAPIDRSRLGELGDGVGPGHPGGLRGQARRRPPRWRR